MQTVTRASGLSSPDAPLLLRGDEVARLLNLSKSKTYELLASGEIPAVRIGRAVRVRPEALMRYLSDREAGK